MPTQEIGPTENPLSTSERGLNRLINDGCDDGLTVIIDKSVLNKIKILT